MLLTLGRLELEGSSYTHLKPLLLLSYLALEGRQDRATLAKLFWPHSEQPRQTLSALIHRLKRDVPGAVEANKTQVWSTVQTDAARLQAAAEAGDDAQVVALYRGAFLRGVALAGVGARLEGWLYDTREQLAELARTAALRRAERSARRGCLSAAAAYIAQAHKPEGAVPADAQTLERMYTLVETVDSPVTFALEREVTELGIDLAAPRTTHKLSASLLPSWRGVFVGREAEQRRLLTQLADPGCRLLTLVGPGGVGKSRLVAEVVFGANGLNLGDDVFYITLDMLNSSELLLLAVAAAFDMTLESGDPLIQIADAVGNRSVLLVLDNFEECIGAATLLSVLLDRCPNLRLLVTSRSELELSWEWVLPLGGFSSNYSGAEAYGEAGHALCDASRLIAERAALENPEGAVPLLTGLCDLVDRIPLALELTAYKVKVHSLAEVVVGLTGTAKHLLTSTDSAREHSDRTRGVQLAFEYTWSLLSPCEQNLLSGLAVFRQSFSGDTAYQLTGATSAFLSHFEDMFLITRFGDRLHFYPQIRSHILTKIPARTLNVLQAKHATFFLDLLTDKRSSLQQGTASKVVCEVVNVLGAWFWCWKHDVKLAQQSCQPLRLLFQQWNRPYEGDAIFRYAERRLKLK